MRYLYRCGVGHEFVYDFPMGQAPEELTEDVCGVGMYGQESDEPINLCGAPIRRVFPPPMIVHGTGMIGYSSWGDKVQRSTEGQERFGKPGVGLK